MLKPFRFLVLLTGLGLALAALAGCESDEVTKYNVPREDPRTRMLAALLPNGDDTWVFKLEGPADAVASQAENFEAFLKSVRVQAPETAPISWKLPAGWQKEADSGRPARGREGRFATLQTDSLPPTEVAVSRFGRLEPLSNVNRWREQLGLEKLTAEDLPKETKTWDVEGDLKATVVDIVGLKKRAAGPPMMGGEVPGGPPTRPGGEKLVATPPEGWNPGPNPAGLRVASYLVTDGDREVDILATPLGEGSGSLLENLNRWRKEVGLQPVSDTAEVKSLTVGDQKGDYVDLQNADFVDPRTNKKQPTRSLIVVVKRPGVVWFFKMKGSPELAEKQKGNFEKWVSGARFEPAAGGKP